MQYEEGDGHEWTVSEDWEAQTGLVNDILHVADTAIYSELQEHFSDKKMFLEVIDALLNLDYGKSLKDRKRAKHRAESYMIEGEKLWKVGDMKSVRSRARMECVTKEEATSLAWEVH